MKVLALNCASGEVDNTTGMLLNAFVEGLKEAGSTAQIIDTNQLEIKKCKACTENYFFNFSDKCIQEDDMNKLYNKFRSHDVWIFAVSSFEGGVHSEFQNIIDRLEPLFTPTIDSIDPDPNENGTIILLSSSILKGKKVFEPYIEQMEALSAIMGKKYAGHLLRPQSNLMSNMIGMGDEYGSMLEIARQAGEEFVTSNEISPTISDSISQELKIEVNL